MATIDYEKIIYENKKKDAYIELIDFLKTSKGRKALPNWTYLLDYLDDNGKKIADMEETIKEYKDFFIKLKSFLPKDHTIHDVIG